MPAPGSQAIIASPTQAAMFLVITVNRGGEEQIRDLLADVSGIRRSVGFRIPEGALSCVTGIGSGLWDRLFTGARRCTYSSPVAQARGAGERNAPAA